MTDHRFLSPAPRPTADTSRCRPALHPARRTPHDGRSTRRPGSDAADAASARRFAELTLRYVIEVLNRRRPLRQLRELAEPRVVDMVRTRADAGGRQPLGLTSAVRVQLDRRGSAEFFAVYATGTRAGAIAGHLTYRRGGWRVDVLRIG